MKSEGTIEGRLSQPKGKEKNKHFGLFSSFGYVCACAPAVIGQGKTNNIDQEQHTSR